MIVIVDKGNEIAIKKVKNESKYAKSFFYFFGFLTKTLNNLVSLSLRKINYTMGRHYKHFYNEHA